MPQLIIDTPMDALIAEHRTGIPYQVWVILAAAYEASQPDDKLSFTYGAVCFDLLPPLEESMAGVAAKAPRQRGVDDSRES